MAERAEEADKSEPTGACDNNNQQEKRTAELPDDPLPVYAQPEMEVFHRYPEDQRMCRRKPRRRTANTSKGRLDGSPEKPRLKK